MKSVRSLAAAELLSVRADWSGLTAAARVVAEIPAWPIVVLFGMAATGLALYATPFGVGTSWDGAMYVGSARNLLAGHGVSIPWGVDAGKPLTHYPPLFPILLAGIGTLGIDPSLAARYANAGLLGVNLVLVAAGAARLSSSTRAAPLVVGFLFLTSVHVANLHELAWSEPLFIPLCFTTLFVLASYVSRPSRRLVLIAAGIAALAILARLVGLALVATGGLLILAAPRQAWKTKLHNVVLFGAVSTGPLVVWLARNRLLGEPVVGNRDLAWRPPTLDQVGRFLRVLLDWFVPDQLAGRLVSTEGVLTPLGVVLLAALLVLAAVVWARRGGGAVLVRVPSTARVLVLFSLVYLGTVIASHALIDEMVVLDSRTLSPMYLACLLLIGMALPGWLRILREQHTLMRAVVLIGAVSLGTFYSARHIATTQRHHVNGISYESQRFLTSRLMAEVGSLPADASIYSNAPEALYILRGRDTFLLPGGGHIDDFVRYVETQPGRPVFVAYFTYANIDYRLRIPTTDLEGRGYTLRLVAQEPDGSLYQVL